tara:strand:- start:102 stop:386 length:285 start_codon:yes stop_codon:yes gene_type:complete
MIRVLILLFSLSVFTSNNLKLTSFEDYNFQNKLNQIFIVQKKKKLSIGTDLNKLLDKLSKINYLSLKIRSLKEKENELQISFSRSSIAIKFILD